MQMSPQGLAELKGYEGCRLDAYRCEAGVLTIGYGDTRNVTEGMRITREECDQRLVDRVAEFGEAVQRAVRRPMTQGQFDALCSLAFNIGSAAFAASTLVKLFNGGDEAGAAREFGKWINITKGGQKQISGALVRRRFAEVVRYFQR